MVPFIVIEVENNSVSETTVFGDSQVEAIVIDWDLIDGDDMAAEDLIREILDHYPSKSASLLPPGVLDLVTKLQKIVSEAKEGFEDEDEDFEDETEDEEDEDEEEEYSLDDAVSDADMIAQAGISQPGDSTAEQKPEYNGNELIGGEPTPLDPRD